MCMCVCMCVCVCVPVYMCRYVFERQSQIASMTHARVCMHSEL